MAAQLAGFKNRFSGWIDTPGAADRNSLRFAGIGADTWYVLLFLNDAYTVYVPVPANTELRAPANEIGKRQSCKGLQAASDRKRICLATHDPEGGAAQRYLVNEQGVPVYLVDPGINGTHRVRPTARQCRSSMRRKQL
jgi:hypothetical protein